MTSGPDLPALAWRCVKDPVEGGKAVLALNPVMAVRWMLLVAAIASAVVVLYALPVLMGAAGDMPPPLYFALWQVGLNLFAITLIAYAGRAFGGTGSFSDALLLMGWLQALTVPLLLVQLVIAAILPALNMLVVMAEVALSIWLLTGFVSAIHGFTSRIAVLVGGLIVLMAVSMVISTILLTLGFVPPMGMTDV
jgi:hypothetical protein